MDEIRGAMQNLSNRLVRRRLVGAWALGYEDDGGGRGGLLARLFG